MTTPHESWASVYDIAYEQSFGEFYHDLTSITIETIENTIKPPAKIVDFGAGTGRLSIPLSSMGYEVLAVEPSGQMLKQLRKKPGASSVSTFQGKMQEFQTDTSYDMAICVFTVILYLLDEESLEKSIEAAANALCHDGFLFIDIPSDTIFQSYQRNTAIMQRSVSVSSKPDDDIYEYSEQITINQNSQSTTYTDYFKIRNWKVKNVLKILSNYGFTIKDDLSSKYAGAGSIYYLMKKDGHS